MSVTVASSAPAASPRWHAHPYNRARYYRVARATVSRLPRPARRWLSIRLARLVAARFPAERAAVRRNLGRIHSGGSAAALDAAVGRVFENFATCFSDLLSLNRGPESQRWRRIAGAREQTPTRDALGKGRGCVSITAHLGNSALAGRLVALLGRRVHVVMAPEADPDVAALLGGGDDGLVRFVRLQSPLVSVQLVSALRRGEIVAFQMDRAIGGRGDRRIPFFGAPAAFPLGPFVIAAAAGAPVVPAFCVLQPSGDYRLHVEPAFEVRRGGEREALGHAVALLERYVGLHWDQWFNFFDVWDLSAHA
jgi:lauroyl/myristoyl acyltransferase